RVDHARGYAQTDRLSGAMWQPLPSIEPSPALRVCTLEHLALCKVRGQGYDKRAQCYAGSTSFSTCQVVPWPDTERCNMRRFLRCIGSKLREYHGAPDTGYC